MKTLKEIKAILASHKEEIKKIWGVIILAIFGSYARDEHKRVDELLEIIRKFERD